LFYYFYYQWTTRFYSGLFDNVSSHPSQQHDRMSAPERPNSCRR